MLSCLQNILCEEGRIMFGKNVNAEEFNNIDMGKFEE